MHMWLGCGPLEMIKMNSIGPETDPKQKAGDLAVSAPRSKKKLKA